MKIASIGTGEPASERELPSLAQVTKPRYTALLSAVESAVNQFTVHLTGPGMS